MEKLKSEKKKFNPEPFPLVFSPLAQTIRRKKKSGGNGKKEKRKKNPNFYKNVITLIWKNQRVYKIRRKDRTGKKEKKSAIKINGCRFFDNSK